MFLMNNGVYTKDLFSLPLESIANDFDNEQLKSGKISIDLKDKEKKDSKLMVFSEFATSCVKSKSLKDLLAYHLFKDVSETSQLFEKKIDEVKKNLNLKQQICDKLNGSFYENYSLSVYLKVNICLVEKFSNPNTILKPLLAENIIENEKISCWPNLYVHVDKDGYYFLITRATYCTRKDLETFLNNNISPIYEELNNSSIKMELKYRRFLSPPYSSSEWFLNEEISNFVKDYSGIHAHIKNPRYKIKIKGIHSEEGKCVIKNAVENTEIKGSEGILDLLNSYFFQKSSKNGMLLLIHIIKQKIKFNELIEEIKNFNLSTFLAATSILLNVNICILINNHFLPMKNILNKYNYFKDNLKPILGIMKKNNIYYVVKKIEMDDNINDSFPQAHSSIEETFFKYFKLAFDEKKDIDFNSLTNEVINKNKNVFPMQVELLAKSLHENIQKSNHYNERFIDYCRLIENHDTIFDIFEDSINLLSITKSTNNTEPIQEQNGNERSLTPIKRPFSSISNYSEEANNINVEFVNDSDNDTIDTEINYPERSDTDGSCISEELSNLYIDQETENEDDIGQNLGKIETGLFNFKIWNPSLLAREILLKNIPKDVSEIYEKNIKNINWSSLINACKKIDLSTPTTYSVFKRNVFAFWEQETKNLIDQKNSQLGRISFNVDGYRHLKDNGNEIIGLISQRHYEEQIVIKVDPSAETIDTLVYIFNYENKYQSGNITTYYYRCKKCKQIEDKIKNDNGEKSATFIKKYNDVKLIKEGSGQNKCHRSNCHPIELFEVIADQYAKVVKQMVSTGLTTFDSAFETMRYNTLCLSTLHKVKYHNIMIHVLRTTQLREECQRITEFKGKNRMEFFESIKYTINSENFDKEKLIRFEGDEMPAGDFTDIIVEKDFIIFGSPLQYIMSSECDVWMADGCHSMVDRKVYEQVYTIHGNFKKIDRFGTVRTKFFPLFSICMKNKSKSLYWHALKKLFHILHHEYDIRLNVETFLIDKEMAAYGAFKDIFKEWNYDVNIEFCYYHYTSNLFKKLQSLGLTGYYMGWKKQKNILYSIIKRYFNLPHIEESKMVDTFKKCEEEMNSKLENLLETARSNEDVKKVNEFLNLQRKTELFAKYVFDNWFSTLEKRNLICKYGKNIRTTNVCETFHKTCKKKGCLDTYLLERSFKHLRIIFDNIEIELKKLQSKDTGLSSQKLRNRIHDERLNDIREHFSLESTENCIEFLDEVGTSFFNEMVHQDDFGNYTIKGIENVTKDIDAKLGDSEVRFVRNRFTSPVKKISRNERILEDTTTPMRSCFDRGLKRLETQGTQCFANSVLQLIFLCKLFLEKLQLSKDDYAMALTRTFTKFKLLNKNSYLKLKENEFFRIDEFKKIVFSGEHECAAGFLMTILNTFQVRFPTEMELLTMKKELKLTCNSCKISNVIEECDLPILNLKISHSDNGKNIVDIIKTMFSDQIESDFRYCSSCRVQSNLNVKRENIRRYPKYLFIELTKDITDINYQNIYVDFLSCKDLLYVEHCFEPSYPYKIMGFVAHTMFNQGKGHYVSYVRHSNSWWCLNDSQRPKEIIEDQLPKNKATILLYEMQ